MTTTDNEPPDRLWAVEFVNGWRVVQSQVSVDVARKEGLMVVEYLRSSPKLPRSNPEEKPT